MTARLVGQSGQSVCLVAVHPVVEGVGMARFEQAMQRDGVRGSAIGDLEQTCGTLAQVGTAVVIAGLNECGALLRCEGEGASVHIVLLS